MKLTRGVMLGSAASLIAIGAAQAADLPVKAKAVEYVKVCSLYGPGFYYIPGTDTCIKLGGYLRTEIVANSNSDNLGNTGLPGGANNRFTNGYTWRSRQDLTLDTRTATEYGLVRTFFEATFNWTTDNYTANPAAAGSSIYSAIGSVSAPNNANNGAVAGGQIGVYYAFIQFAGFMFGKAVLQFSTPWVSYPGNTFDGLVGGGGAATGVNQFTYTAEFGNGVSASVSAQDQTGYNQAGVNNILAGGAYGTSDYAGTIAPDVVGMLRVDQAWGLFQASVAAHDNHAAYYGATELTGHPDDKWGWAGQLALSIKNIPTGEGDTINIQGVYTNGATRYNITDLAFQAGANQIYGSTSLPGAYQSIGIGFAPDSVFGAIGGVNTSQQLITTWGMRGAYTHNWDPYWNTAIYGAYAGIRYNGTAKTLLCGVGGVGGSVRAVLNAAGGTISTCNPDYNIAQLGVVTRWTPVRNLTFSADLTYTHLDQNYVGTVSAPSATVGKPAAIYELKDQNTIALQLRAQRNF